MRTSRGLKSLLAVTLLGASTSLWAIPSSTVGSVDTLIDSANVFNLYGSSGEADEEAWVESVLGFDVVFDDKMDGGFNWELVDGTTSTYAQSFLEAPDYYLVKVGNLKDTDDTHFLFRNIAELYYGVINLADMGFNLTKEGVGKISHISLFDTTTTDIPEPSVLTLFVLGLAGLVLARRKAV